MTTESDPIAWVMISGFARALAAVADVTTKGANKYTRDGWVSVPDGPTRYMDAFARHALKLGSGETIDQDTGCSHKAAMIWNLCASLELELRANAPSWKTVFGAPDNANHRGIWPK